MEPYLAGLGEEDVGRRQAQGDGEEVGGRAAAVAPAVSSGRRTGRRGEAADGRGRSNGGRRARGRGGRREACTGERRPAAGQFVDSIGRERQRQRRRFEQGREGAQWRIGGERGTRAAPLVSGTATLTAGKQPQLFASGKRLPLANLYESSPVVRV